MCDQWNFKCGFIFLLSNIETCATDAVTEWSIDFLHHWLILWTKLKKYMSAFTWYQRAEWAAVLCADWRFESARMSLTCCCRECDDWVFFNLAAECALKALCAFVKSTAGRDQWNGGRRRRNSGCFLSVHASLRCSSPPPSALRARARVCGEWESECQTGGTAGVGQSVNAADSYRRFPGYQRRKAPFGSLYIAPQP